MDVKSEIMPEIDQLPKSLRMIAVVIGMEDTMKLSVAFAGSTLLIHNMDWLDRRVRNSKIRESYDRGETSVIQLSRRFNLSTRCIEKILGGHGDC